MSVAKPQDIALEMPPGPKPTPAAALTEQWRDVFYLHGFLHLCLSEGQIGRRESVWIRRFLKNRNIPELYAEMDEIVRQGHCDIDSLRRLTTRAKAELSMGEKRRFIFNLAQMCQSKGQLGDAQYGQIIDLALQLGVPDNEADDMLSSVFQINETFFAVLGLLACGTIIYLTRSVVIPLVIALFITMIISRVDGAIAKLFKVRRLRWLSKLAAMVAILGVIFALVLAAIVSGTDIANGLPGYQTRLEATLHDSVQAQHLLTWLDEKGVTAQLKQLPIGSMATDLLASLVGLLSNFVLVAIFTGFLVSSSSAFTGILAEMNKKTGTYISTKSLMSLLTGLTVFGLCWAFGVDFALFWALLAFIFNYIPVVGAIVASIPAILLAIIQLQSWLAIGTFIALMVISSIALGQIIEPKLMGNRLAIKPVAILFGLVFWGLLWGIPGMFLATPLMVLLRILASHFNFSRSFERLLSTESV